MNEVENCLQNKIANANGVIQPIILQAILNLYQQGLHVMTAGMVKNECFVIDQNILWSERIPAIYNAMRNTIECGAEIMSENRPHNNFTISFNGNNNNSIVIKPRKKEEKKADKYKVSSETNQSTSIKNLKKEKMSNNITVKEKMEKLFSTLDKSIIGDKSKPKLLIIGCSDAKQFQPNDLENGDFVNYNFGNNITNQRIQRREYYQELPDAYFNNKKRNNVVVNRNYFMAALDENNRRKALCVYGSSRSPFYNLTMKDLYIEKTANSKLHLLIVSGLYGIIKYDDYINDYHLKIDKGNNIWGNSLLLAVEQYIKDNTINNNAVFYSLSDKYLSKLNPPNEYWTDLWINGDRIANLKNSARFLKEYFLPNL